MSAPAFTSMLTEILGKKGHLKKVLAKYKDTRQGGSERKRLEQAKYHDAVFSRGGFKKLEEDFINTTRFKLFHDGVYIDVTGAERRYSGEDVNRLNQIYDVAKQILSEFNSVIEYTLTGTDINRTQVKHTGTGYDLFINWVTKGSSSNTSRIKGRDSGTEILNVKRGYNVRNTEEIYAAINTGDSSVGILKGIPQDELKSLFIRFLSTIWLKQYSRISKNSLDLEFSFKIINAKGIDTGKTGTVDPISFIKANLQAGHLAGIAYLKLQEIFKHSSKNYDGEELDILEKFKRLTLDADKLSSNLILNLNVIAEAEKGAKGIGKRGASIRVTTELQLSALNALSGAAMQNLGKVLGDIEDIVEGKNPDLSNIAKQFMASFSPIVTEIKNQVASLSTKFAGGKTEKDIEIQNDLAKVLKNAEFIESLISTPGSLTVKQLIKKHLGGIITNETPIPDTYTKTPKVQVAKETANLGNEFSKGFKSIVQRIDRAIKNKKQSMAKYVTSVKSSEQLRLISKQNSSSEQVSLIKLQTLINSQLSQRIKQNMIKPALQNRTGRFAESAKVERLSESRQGMITAFYSYMKSPYQTFEPGFKQGSEKRNPKTLISKSIREIASTIVGNRLRAVRL